MKNDFIAELGYIGFTARIKRISDLLMYSAINHYRSSNIGIEPNWHLVLLLLSKEGSQTVTQIAERLYLSHPAIIKIIKKMKESGLVESTTHQKDGRKQLISLSEKAVRLLPVYQQEWATIERVLLQMVDEELLDKLDAFEKNFRAKSFSERYHELNN